MSDKMIVAVSIPENLGRLLKKYRKQHPEFNSAGYLRQFLEKLLKGENNK